MSNLSIAKQCEKRLSETEDLSVYCSWEANGERCRYPGNISHSTLGGGPWYCRFHIHRIDPLTASRIVEESLMPANRAAYYAPQKQNEERKKSKRNEAVSPTRMREPGEDDDE